MQNKIIIWCFVLLITVNLSCAKRKHKYGSRETPIKYQPNDIPMGYTDGKMCKRSCDGTPMSCFFRFNIETFYTMNKACNLCPKILTDCYRPDCIVAGGVSRTVMVVNRQLPGPVIEVCEGDELMVQLENNLQDGQGTTIHWHGFHMSIHQDKYMDGVPYVTQCPIHYNNNFTYEFWVEYAGTYWWHSHVETQRGDGFYGALIVRQTTCDNPHIDLYDFDLTEHVILAGDWNDRTRLDVFEASSWTSSSSAPTGIIVNSFGFQSTSNNTDTPPANFTVTHGFRYRFRLVNTGFFDCPLELSIDGHKLLVIALDARDIQPIEVDSFVSAPGERFDFVVDANQDISTYYIRVKGLQACKRGGIYTVALLRYEGTQIEQPTGPYPTYLTSAPTGGVLLSPVSIVASTGYSQVIGIHQTKALQAIEDDLITDDVYRFYISVDISTNQVSPYWISRTPQFNRISHKPLDVPLLTNRFEIDQSLFCNEDSWKNRNCSTNYCECPHVIEVPQNAVVEFVYMELSGIAVLHPMHLHGYSFRVLGWGELGKNLTKEYIMGLDQQGKLLRNFDNPPWKDTVTVPGGGYTIIRFKAYNTGYWLMHCHIEVHASKGMDMVLKVGNDSDMPSVPKRFPRCGNWMF